MNDLVKQAKEIHTKICNRKFEGNRVHPKVLAQEIKNVHETRQNNFTVVVINNQYVGVAKRNPTDKDNQDVGTAVALHRAVENLLAASV